MLPHRVISRYRWRESGEPGLGLPTSGLSGSAGAEEELVWRPITHGPGKRGSPALSSGPS